MRCQAVTGGETGAVEVRGERGGGGVVCVESEGKNIGDAVVSVAGGRRHLEDVPVVGGKEVGHFEGVDGEVGKRRVELSKEREGSSGEERSGKVVH